MYLYTCTKDHSKYMKRHLLYKKKTKEFSNHKNYDEWNLFILTKYMGYIILLTQRLSFELYVRKTYEQLNNLIISPV